MCRKRENGKGMKLQRYKGVSLKLLGGQIANQEQNHIEACKFECRNPSGMETLSSMQWFYKKSNEIHLKVRAPFGMKENCQEIF